MLEWIIRPLGKYETDKAALPIFEKFIKKQLKNQIQDLLKYPKILH